MLKKFIQMALPKCIKSRILRSLFRKEVLCSLYPKVKMPHPTATEYMHLIIKKVPLPPNMHVKRSSLLQ